MVDINDLSENVLLKTRENHEKCKKKKEVLYNGEKTNNGLASFIM